VIPQHSPTAPTLVREPFHRDGWGVRGEDRGGGRVEMMLAGFVILVGGLAALLYRITTRRSMPPLEPEQEREKGRHLRDNPNP